MGRYDFFPQRRILTLDSCESTNTLMKDRIKDGSLPQFAVIRALSQSGGRGRLGRSFFSPAGGLYFSAVYPLNGDEKEVAAITLLAGLEAQRAIKDLCGLDTRIKLPNDIYVGDKKLCGILCESIFAGGDSMTAIVGMGINLDLRDSVLPPELQSIVTSIAGEGKAPPDGNALIKNILRGLDLIVYKEELLYGV